jgi:TatD DNase family protein
MPINYPESAAPVADQLPRSIISGHDTSAGRAAAWHGIFTADMDWIDIGINLTHGSFDADRDAVIARAAAAGVTQLIVTGATVAGSEAALELARGRPGRLFATAGVHPHHSAELDAGQLERLRELLASPAVVAAGECGLDYFRNYAPRQTQLRAFEQQLALAGETGKPVFLHQRDAHADFVALLRDHRDRLHGGVAHCFTGGAAELEDYLDIGLAIGITGWICDERRGQHLHALVPRIPPDRLLLETDGPYLLPRDLLPKPANRRNEPAFLPHIAALVARLRSESLAQCAAQTSTAARKLFGLPEAPSL